ncbi:hypothetical protein GQ457_12G012160 [Hibiscus cannabinus]
MSSRGLKLAVPPEMQQNPCLELNNGDSSRVLCPKSIREYSLHVGDNSCRECHVGNKYLAALASFLYVEPIRLKLGFFVLPLAWDGPP